LGWSGPFKKTHRDGRMAQMGLRPYGNIKKKYAAGPHGDAWCPALSGSF
jgi:hypothetical protein